MYRLRVFFVMTFLQMMFQFTTRSGGARSVGVFTVYRAKRRFVEGNLPHGLSEQQRSGALRKLSDKEEALLIGCG